MATLFDCLPDRLLRKKVYISMSAFTLNSVSFGVSWSCLRQTRFNIPACVCTSSYLCCPICPLAFLPAFLSLVPLPCSLHPPPVLAQAPLLPVPQQPLLGPPVVLLGPPCPATTKVKGGRSGPCGSTVREVLPVASWKKTKLRHRGGIRHRTRF